jgi:formyl-CoA transferase
VRQLVAKSDVLLENFRPGTLERWGMSPEQLWEINPRLVVHQSHGVRPGRALRATGRLRLDRRGDGRDPLRHRHPDLAPSRAGISLGDSLAATFACIGTLVALHQRERTGRGQVVDSAIYEAVLAMMESLVPEWQVAGYQRERTGPVLPNVAPSNVYPTRTARRFWSPPTRTPCFGASQRRWGAPISRTTSGTPHTVLAAST